MDDILKKLRQATLAVAPQPFRLAAKVVTQLNQQNQFAQKRPNAPKMQMPTIQIPRVQLPKIPSIPKIDWSKVGTQLQNQPITTRTGMIGDAFRSKPQSFGGRVLRGVATDTANTVTQGVPSAIRTSPIFQQAQREKSVLDFIQGNIDKNTLEQRLAPPPARTQIQDTFNIGKLGLSLYGLPKTTLKNVAISAGISGGLNKAMGGSFEEGVTKGIANAPFFAGLTGRITNPLISKTANTVAPRVAKSPVGQAVVNRLTTGAMNVPEGIVIDKSLGFPTTPGSMAIDFASGALLGSGRGGVQRPTVVGKSAVPVKKWSIVVKEEEPNIRDVINRFETTIGEASDRANPKMDLNLDQDVNRLWKRIYGADRNAPKDISQAYGDVLEAYRGWRTEREMVEQGISLGLTDNRKNVGVGIIKRKSSALPSRLLKTGIQGATEEESIFGQNVKNVLTNNKMGQKLLLKQEAIGQNPLAQVTSQEGPKVLKGASQPYDDIITQARKIIGETPQKPDRNLSQVASDLYTDWVDRFHPITKLAKVAEDTVKGQRAELRPEANPRYLLKRFLGMGSIAQQRFDSEFKPILNQLDDLEIDKIDLDTYLKARRDLGFESVGRKIFGSDPKAAAQVIAAYEGKYGDNIKNVAQQLYDYQNKGFQELVDAGFIDPQKAETIKRLNPDYAPFERVMDEIDNYLGMPSQTVQQATSPLKKIKGSERQILSPVESMIANTFKQRAAIEKNKVAKSIVGLGDVIGDAFTKSSTQTDSTIAVWNNGKKEYYEVGNEIARSVRGMNEEQSNTLLKILSAPSALLRQGATGRNPDFMLPNIARDQVEAAVNSKYGYVPVLDYIRGFSHIAKNDDIYQQWKMSGAAQSFGSLSGRKQIKELFNEKTAKKNLFSWIGKGLDTMGKYSEEPTRVGLFSKALNKTGNPLLAVMESRESTLDFARMGAKMKVANSLIPFLNVGVQGLDKLIRTAKNNPGRMAVAVGLYGVAPQLTTTLYNTFNFPEEYKEIPQYVKDANYVLVNGRNENGTVSYVTIPKANSIQLIANPIENFISYVSNTSQSTLSEMVTQFLSSAIPVIGDGQSLSEVALKTVGSNTPQAVKPLTENLLNKSFFKYNTKTEEAKEIVPYYLKDKPAGEQTYEFTPAVYQKLGKVLNVSPLQIQNLAEGYLAGFTKIPVNIVDSMIAIGNNEDIDQNKIPILRRFFQTTYPSSKPKSEYTDITPKEPTSTTGLFGKADATKESKDGKVSLKIKYTTEAGGTVNIDIGKVKSMPSTNRYDEATKKSKAYSVASQIMDAPVSKEEKEKYLKEIGISYNEANYYDIASRDTNEKSSFVTKQLDSLQNQNVTQKEFLTYLENLRKNVNGERIASDGVIDNLVTDGYIPYETGKALKKVKPEVTPKAKIYKAKKPKKIKVPKIKYTPEKPIKLKKIKPLKFTKLKIGKRKKVK